MQIGSRELRKADVGQSRGMPSLQNAERGREFSDYLLRNILGSTTHIVNNPTNAPAATIASISASREISSRYIVCTGVTDTLLTC